MQSTRYSCQILIKIEFSRQIFKKLSNIKYIKNPSRGSWIVFFRTERQTGRQWDRQDMTKLIIPLRNFANAPKNKTFVLDANVWVWQKDSVRELAYCCTDFNFVHHFLILGFKDRLNPWPFLLQNSFDTQRYRTALTLRRLMSYIYGAPILDVSRSHTTTQHSR